MKKWFISDTHFSRKTIIKDFNRPYETVEKMNERLIENWNNSVGFEDHVFFLGDFGQGNVDHLRSICSQLKGRKTCIRGEMDRKASDMMRIGFLSVLESA
jgi:calcineurin-like phosphoesterase family protein